MKRSFCIFVLGFAVVAAPALGAKRTRPYLFNLYLADNASFTAQFKGIFKGLPKPIKEKYGVDFKLEYALSREDFAQKLTAKPPSDFALSVYYDDNEVLEKAGYRPLGSFSAWGTDKNVMCIFAAKKSKAKTLEDLRGTTGAMYDSKWAYIVARHWFKGEDPAKFFKTARPIKNGMSGLLGIATGTEESALVYQSIEYLMKQSNPGAMKKVKKVACMDYGFALTPPVHVHKSVPKDVIQSFHHLFETGNKDPLFAHWHRLMRAYKIKLIKTTPEQEAKQKKMLKRAVDEKWYDDRDAWFASLAD